jgi:hypothetical protein
MDRAALLPLLQAVPLLVEPFTAASPSCPGTRGEKPPDLVVDPAFEPRLD